MATIIFPFVAVDGNGHVRANAKLYFYETGTTTPQATYSDSALSVTNTNPVVADSNGLFTGIYLGDQPDFEAYKAILKDSADVTIWTQDPIAGAPLTTPISASLLRGYLSGIQRTSSTTTTLTLGAGVCADDTNTVMLSLDAGTINCATVGADGLDAGALANSTWYHKFAIGKTDGTTARLASTSVSSPTMPSGYIYKRRVGSFRTNGSAQIIPAIQDGDLFQWTAAVSDLLTINPGTSAVLATLSVPSGVNVRAIFQGFFFNADTSNVSNIVYSDPDTTDVAASQTNTDGVAINAAGGTSRYISRQTTRTDTSSRIRYRTSFSSTAVQVGINTTGWLDRRGRDG